jgi:hypothetical protein
MELELEPPDLEEVFLRVMGTGDTHVSPVPPSEKH